MVTEHLDDGEGELLARVRKIVGPRVPIVASLDLHANVTRAMVEHADGARRLSHLSACRHGGDRRARRRSCWTGCCAGRPACQGVAPARLPDPADLAMHLDRAGRRLYRGARAAEREHDRQCSPSRRASRWPTIRSAARRCSAYGDDAARAAVRSTALAGAGRRRRAGFRAGIVAARRGGRARPCAARRARRARWCSPTPRTIRAPAATATRWGCSPPCCAARRATRCSDC